ncbi:intraflagellar transport protein 57 homolog [Lepeophtheirus salmonis]|uniref:intraflagellar transport protein 57 homolog n=1 Tax=Lepeophtheirus salmonis TaxID=72036 RepID=UPI001AE46815|nr:intraflagellar transport protein 57 homolog isoform X1 [Lepeophtheirus salmonis]
MSASKTKSDKEDSSENEIDGGPGLAFMPFVIMENLVDKLKLLNYEDEFVSGLKMRPLSRHYFVLPNHPGEQFYLFTSLAAWLIRKSGGSFDQPQESDDPNSVIANLLDHVRRQGIAIDFPPSKLKQGCGEQAIFVLDRLSDEALRIVGFEWAKPNILMEDGVGDDDEIEDDAEVNLDKVEEEMAGNYSEDDDDEGEILHIDDIYPTNRGLGDALSDPFSNGKLLSKPNEILRSTTDEEEWKMEVERVIPQLKVTIRIDVRDWRTHLEQMHCYRDGIEEALGTTKFQLDKLYTEITKTLEKISSREKYLNSQLEVPISQYRTLIDTLSASKERYKQVNGGVTERSRQLAQIADELESAKAEMEERGSSMTDGSPLVNIKKSLARIKSESTAMDVRMGVVKHILLQAKMKDRSIMQRDMNKISMNTIGTFY